MNALIKKIASVKITTFCVFWLFVLTFWGTVAQVSNGLYAAQERYFFSFFFLVGGFLPIPGAQGILWVMFVNLTASVITHFSKMRSWRSAGLKLSHLGVFLYFVAAFATFHLTQETHVRLMEGESTNVGTSYHQWEISFWSEQGTTKKVTAYDIDGVKPGQVIQMDDVRVIVGQFYPNAQAFTSERGNQEILNASGINVLKSVDIDKDREKNTAGGIFNIDGRNVILFGGESTPTKIGDRYFMLRHRRYPLPFLLKLKKFKAEFHPGTQVASSFESFVEVIKNNTARDVRIFMNNPLREKDFTFYQASYDADAMGRQYSTLAVVKNAGQVLPYIACFAVFFGLALHFILAALDRKRT